MSLSQVEINKKQKGRLEEMDRISFQELGHLNFIEFLGSTDGLKYSFLEISCLMGFSTPWQRNAFVNFYGDLMCGIFKAYLEDDLI